MARMTRFEDATSIQEHLVDLWDNVRQYPRRLKYWTREKFTKTTIKIDTLHGGWHDKDDQMLHVNFQLLVNFVEEEVALMADICLGKERIPNAKTKREKGLAYLMWEDDRSDATEDENAHYKAQKEKERKIVDLYLWWKDIRPARVDVLDTNAYTEFEDFEPYSFEPAEKGCSRMVKNNADERYTKWSEIMDQSRQQDIDWDKEDTEKLIELINLRHHLWT